MNFEIDLQVAISNPEKAAEVVKKIQTTIDELVLANKEYRDVSNNAIKVAEDFEAQAIKNQESLKQIADVLKGAHLIIGRHIDIFKDHKEMIGLFEALGAFATSSGAIKLGVK